MGAGRGYNRRVQSANAGALSFESDLTARCPAMPIVYRQLTEPIRLENVDDSKNMKREYQVAVFLNASTGTLHAVSAYGRIGGNLKCKIGDAHSVKVPDSRVNDLPVDFYSVVTEAEENALKKTGGGYKITSSHRITPGEVSAAWHHFHNNTKAPRQVLGEDLQKITF